MQGDRKERVGEFIRQELSEIILKEMKDPRVGFVTVTGVAVSPDLHCARVFVSILGDDEQRKETLSILKHAAGFLRREIGHRLRLRYCPELTVHYDDSLETAARIEQVLDEIKKDTHDG